MGQPKKQKTPSVEIEIRTSSVAVEDLVKAIIDAWLIPKLVDDYLQNVSLNSDPTVRSQDGAASGQR